MNGLSRKQEGKQASISVMPCYVREVVKATRPFVLQDPGGKGLWDDVVGLFTSPLLQYLYARGGAGGTKEEQTAKSGISKQALSQAPVTAAGMNYSWFSPSKNGTGYNLPAVVPPSPARLSRALGGTHRIGNAYVLAAFYGSQLQRLTTPLLGRTRRGQKCYIVMGGSSAPPSR